MPYPEIVRLLDEQLERLLQARKVLIVTSAALVERLLPPGSAPVKPAAPAKAPAKKPTKAGKASKQGAEAKTTAKGVKPAKAKGKAKAEVAAQVVQREPRGFRQVKAARGPVARHASKVPTTVALQSSVPKGPVYVPPKAKLEPTPKSVVVTEVPITAEALANKWLGASSRAGA